MQYVKIASFAFALGYMSGSVSAEEWQKPTLPAALALEAAKAAVEKCAAGGDFVSVSVVDNSGELRAFLKGDKATVHTRDSSFRKAYTTVTFGPVFAFDRSSDFVAKLKANPNAPALASIPNILPLPGAVAVKVDNVFLAAIGVSGAPDGMRDEACAKAGLDAIHDKLEMRTSP